MLFILSEVMESDFLTMHKTSEHLIHSCVSAALLIDTANQIVWGQPCLLGPAPTVADDFARRAR